MGFTPDLLTDASTRAATDLALVREELPESVAGQEAAVAFGLDLGWQDSRAASVRAPAPRASAAEAEHVAWDPAFAETTADPSSLQPLAAEASTAHFTAAGRTLLNEAVYGGLTQTEAAFASPAQPAEDALLSQELAAQVPAAPAAPDQSQLVDGYGKLPLSFEPNRGQTDAPVQFLARGPGYTLFLTATEAVLSLPIPVAASDTEPDDTVALTALRMQVVGANPGARAAGRAELPGKVNYFNGNDPSRWFVDVPTYGRVEFPQVYSGIDLVYYGNQQDQLEYDFIVAPGADPSQVSLRFAGADRLEIAPDGDLVLHTAAGALRQHRPILYQEADGGRQEVAGSYVLQGDSQVGFRTGAYDDARPLVIDPVLTYSTYLGGTMNEDGFAIAVDSMNRAYAVGQTTSTNYPTTAGAYQLMNRGLTDAFISRLNAAGTALNYSTYLGGNGNDRINDVVVDSANNAYVTGRTASTNFPTTAGAFQTFHRGGTYDAFVTKIAPAGNALVYSSYLGGGTNDAGFGIALGPQNNAYVAGGSDSEDFPTTASAYQYVNYGTDTFLTKMTVAGNFVDYSTFVGGSNRQERALAVAVDSAGNAYVAGQTSSPDFAIRNAVQPTFGGGAEDAFCYKINPSLTGDPSLIYSTYLGGSNDDIATGVAVNASGQAHMTGFTASTNYPTTAGAYQTTFRGGLEDGFVTKLNAAGNGRVYSTFLGGGGNDRGSGIALNAAGEAHITGYTSSVNFPTVNPSQPANAGLGDAFVTKFNAAGSGLIYSTYLGGSLEENLSGGDVTFPGGIALDSAGNAYVIGKTESANFPTANPYQAMRRGTVDAFVTKLTDTPPALAWFGMTPFFDVAFVNTPVTTTVSALNAAFQVIPSFTGSIFFYSTDPLATLPAIYTYVPADMGVRTFTNGVTFRTPGIQALFVFDFPGFQFYGFSYYYVI